MFDDDYNEYDSEITKLKRIPGRKEKLPIVYRHRKKNILKTKWNKNYKKSPQNVPYIGYQDPGEIDWSQYGPDRPTKRKNKKEYAASSTSFENSFVAKFSFFGLLLPGILGTLFFLGVPIAKVGVIEHIISVMLLAGILGRCKPCDHVLHDRRRKISGG